MFLDLCARVLDDSHPSVYANHHLYSIRLHRPAGTCACPEAEGYKNWSILSHTLVGPFFTDILNCVRDLIFQTER